MTMIKIMNQRKQIERQMQRVSMPGKKSMKRSKNNTAFSERIFAEYTVAQVIDTKFALSNPAYSNENRNT